MTAKMMLAGLAGLAFAGASHAQSVVVDGLGGEVVMEAGDLSAFIDPGTTVFGESPLSSLHAQLNGAGIVTDDMVTFVLGDTDAGLTFFSLIDSNNEPAGGTLASTLSMNTAGPSSMSRFINAEGGDLTGWLSPGNGIQLFQALFAWDAIDEADAFAWGGLEFGDAVTFSFNDGGASGLLDDPFQFVSYNGGNWEVVGTADFSTNDQFVFSFNVIPAPGAASVLLVGALFGRRRRRS